MNFHDLDLEDLGFLGLDDIKAGRNENPSQTAALLKLATPPLGQAVLAAVAQQQANPLQPPQTQTTGTSEKDPEAPL